MPDTRPVLSVSQLNRQARQLLEDCFPAIWVEGEISGFSAPASGHWYFSLKDAQAQIGCAMFRSQNSRVRIPVVNGQKVLVRGRLTLYEARGQYQLVVDSLEDAGAGALQRAFEALKAKLQAEGLFDSARKRPLPAVPRHLGLVTSPDGAALHDILTVLQRRFPALPVTLLPTPVQGDTAPERIAAAITAANRFAEHLSPPLDLLIVGRGGGSPEDLQAFNSETVARAIAASTLPVVSAVGHETDVSIADFVADLRAPTPSAAAEHISPDRAEWLKLLAYRENRLHRQLRHRLEQARQTVDHLARRLRHPGQVLAQQQQQLLSQQRQLQQALNRLLHTRKNQLERLQWRLQQQNPAAKLPLWQQQLAQQQQRLHAAWRQQQQTRQLRLGHQARLLDSLSPLSTLGRGYAILYDDQEQILRDTRNLQPGTRISARLARGSLIATVDTIKGD